MMKKKLFALTAGIGLALGSSVAHASIIGDTFEVDYRFPSLTDHYQDTQFTPAFSGDSTTIQGGIDTVTFFDDMIRISMSPGCGVGCTQTPAAFNGIIIYDLTNPLLDASVSSANFSGYT